MKVHCSVIDKDVEVTSVDGQLNVECRYFKRIPKGPVCRRILFGPTGFPIPTTTNIATLPAKMFGRAIIDYLGASFGIGSLPSWYCKACCPEVI